MFYFIRKYKLKRLGYIYHPHTQLWSDNQHEMYIHDNIIRRISYGDLLREKWWALGDIFYLIDDLGGFAVIYGGKFSSYDILETLVYKTLYPDKKLEVALKMLK